MADARLLIVDDEPDFRSMLQVNFEAEGYEVLTAADGVAGLALHREVHPDLILLDLMLPRMDGLQFIRALREAQDEVPVLMLTARSDERTKLKGFDLGADDYLTKPFSVLELLSRVRAILRRARKESAVAPDPILVSGPFQLDRKQREFRRGTERLDVGLQGVRILEVLFLACGQVHSRGDLLNLAWSPNDRPGLRTVDAHIFLIRKALGEERAWLATVGGMGYRWTHPVASSRA
jgi:DNA-binding response OmpR family regulator